MGSRTFVSVSAVKDPSELTRYQAPDECRRRTMNSTQADGANHANHGHLDKGPGSPDLVPLGEELTPASQQAGTDMNVSQCDTSGATSPGTINLNNAMETGQGTSN